jgi:hypothetical protein
MPSVSDAVRIVLDLRYRAQRARELYLRTRSSAPGSTAAELAKERADAYHRAFHAAWRGLGERDRVAYEQLVHNRRLQVN